MKALESEDGFCPECGETPDKGIFEYRDKGKDFYTCSECGTFYYTIMRLSDYIRKNRVELDKYIHRYVPGLKIDDDERETWIMNDEILYLDALARGVDLHV